MLPTSSRFSPTLIKYTCMLYILTTTTIHIETHMQHSYFLYLTSFLLASSSPFFYPFILL